MARERLIGLTLLLATLIGALAVYVAGYQTTTVTAKEIITVSTNLNSAVNVITYGIGTADMGTITISAGADLGDTETATYRLYIELVGYSGDGRLKAMAVRILLDGSLKGAVTLVSPGTVIEETVASGESDQYTLKLWYVAVKKGTVTIDLKISVEVVSVS